MGCNQGEFPDIGWCWTCPSGAVRDVAHIESNRACVIPARTEFRNATLIGRVACGRLNEQACAIVGRNSCDPGLVEFDNVCRARGDCGTEGKRRCLAGEPGAWEPLTGCAIALVPTNNVCTHPACGRLDERACAIVGRNSCDPGLVEFDNVCRTRGDCGTEGKRRCLAGEPGAWEPLTGCATTLVPTNNVCTRPACGRLDERACAIVGRNSCDPGLVEFDNVCRTRGDCGTVGKRRCLAGEPGIWEPLTGCAITLVPTNNVCTHPACGRLGQQPCAIVGRASCDPGLVQFGNVCLNCGRLDERACAVVGRNSCDPGLVEFDNVCRTRGNCGAAGQRACLIGESSRVGCRPGLSEQGGQCYVCGALGQRACAIVGRNSCDNGLVEVNDMCFTRGDCGAADQRACLVGERARVGCNTGLSERAGRCEACGALGDPACAIVGRRSCDPGLVEASNTCFQRGACGHNEERACLIGERPVPGCDTGLSERDGMCWAPAPLSTQAVPPYFVLVRLDPPLAYLFGGRAVSLVATVFNWHTKKLVVASNIELFQAPYTGPGSGQPVRVATCVNLQSCSTVIARGNAARWPGTVSFKARVTVGSTTVETPVRLADLRFVGAPMRLDVATEALGNGTIRQVPSTRTVDIVFYAGTGYELSTPNGARVFSQRLLAEQQEMLRADAKKLGASALAENWAATSFHVSLSAATVKAGGWRLGGLGDLLGANQCEHSTPNPVPWGDAQGILHPGIDCRDWSVPGPFYSAGSPAISWHEMHHAAFGLSDEYCVGTIHHQHPRFPNVYTSKAECVRLGSNASTCARIAEPAGCNGAACSCSTDFWRSDSSPNETMTGNGLAESLDDLRAVRGKFLECRAGRC